mgnify:CR=1 FL=1
MAKDILEHSGTDIGVDLSGKDSAADSKTDVKKESKADSKDSKDSKEKEGKHAQATKLPASAAASAAGSAATATARELTFEDAYAVVSKHVIDRSLFLLQLLSPFYPVAASSSQGDSLQLSRAHSAVHSSFSFAKSASFGFHSW